MKIRSVTDVITNSSTEVFILKDPRNSDEVNKMLKDLGYRGEVIKLTKDYYQENKENDNNLSQLDNIFVDPENYNSAWFEMYTRHIFYPEVDTPKELIQSFKTEVLDLVAEENKKLSRFSLYLQTKDPRDFPSYDLVYGEKGKERFKNWVLRNKTMLPDYQDLLGMFWFHDISEILDSWIDFFEDDCISPSKYLGGVYDNDEINYTCVRLS